MIDCQQCTNWQFPEDPTTSLYHGAMFASFPADAVAGKEFNFGGGRIETPLLISAWREACTAVATGRWTDTATTSYLKTLCLNESTIKALIK